MNLLRAAHSGYVAFIFSLLFVVLFPLLLIPILFPSCFRLVGIINRWWAKGLFRLCFIPYRVETRGVLDPERQYIFCPNHFSYLDIPTMGLNPVNSIFVGKNEMERIPLFGFMYRKLHITVDRSAMKSRVNSMLRSMEALDNGKSLVIYPEGGIVSSNPPTMAEFKDGAFKAAFDKQIPVVPVTIPHNWIILPDEEHLRIRRGTVRVIFHEPIEINGNLTAEDLKKRVKSVIETELIAQNVRSTKP